MGTQDAVFERAVHNHEIVANYGPPRPPYSSHRECNGARVADCLHCKAHQDPKQICLSITLGRSYGSCSPTPVLVVSEGRMSGVSGFQTPYQEALETPPMSDFALHPRRIGRPGVTRTN
ncbi:hypothetical protein CC1G_10626 [Coprinopsis cinerea okayama7|uniref:Uncharacterized protein n=1 Tax=Coprinopsis cinerea (strain Okayama-7 / 130 / ATCC MYA-4618 / FGSC 9003) TaxID=240176 RepID=A8P616_COPC7|nr:hypothetical protein CC1G_10626 [Coprinopsis cinerea okayama7\|eukprot:XP_001839061.2 hypothetical protein CC1G_10626 [Coprinopsis cinerea okayama7\